MPGLQQSQAPLPASETSEAIALFLLLPRAVLLLLFALQKTGLPPAEAGHLVIGTLHTKSCAETIDRMINFYEVRDQAQIKYLLSSLLKLVVSQRLLPGKDDKMVLIPEVMVVDNVVSGVIRRDKISVSEIEDAIQSGTEKGSVSLITSLSQLFIDDKLTLEQAKGQIEEKNIEVLNRTIMQLRIKKGKSMYMNN